jgi:hypothetical protein
MLKNRKTWMGLMAGLLTLGAHPAWAGSYDIASQMLLSDIIPGTEQVKMLPDGGLEQRGRMAGWQKKGGRWGGWTVGPHLVPAPGVCGTNAVYCDHVTASGSHQIDNLLGYQAEFLQEFSLYAWLPGPQCSGMAPGVPGDQHICFFKPLPGIAGPALEAWNEGAYIFGDFKPLERQLAPNKVSYNIKGDTLDEQQVPPHPIGWTDARGEWRALVMAGDNMADTPIVEFAPPVLRYAVLAEFSALARKAKDAHHVLAAESLIQFARDLANDTARQQALREWEASLKENPNQPLVAHWLKLYRGFTPPTPYTAPNPVPDVPPIPQVDTADGVLQRCTYLRLRDIAPGTERVALLPNGDFEKGDDGRLPVKDKPGLRVGDLSGGLTSRLPNISAFWGKTLVCETPPTGGSAEIRAAVPPLPPGEYIISAYVTPLGLEAGSGGSVKEQRNMGAIVIGFPGEASLWWGWPARHAWLAQEGFFMFSTIKIDAAKSDRVLRIRVGPWDAKQAAAVWKTPAGKAVGVCAIFDNIAVTPVAEFRPPQLRANAQLEFRAAGETNMVEFLRDLSKADLLQQTLAQWKTTLAAKPGQPELAYWLDVWSGYRPVPSYKPVAWRVTRGVAKPTK